MQLSKRIRVTESQKYVTPTNHECGGIVLINSSDLNKFQINSLIDSILALNPELLVINSLKYDNGFNYYEITEKYKKNDKIIFNECIKKHFIDTCNHMPYLSFKNNIATKFKKFDSNMNYSFPLKIAIKAGYDSNFIDELSNEEYIFYKENLINYSTTPCYLEGKEIYEGYYHGQDLVIPSNIVILSYMGEYIRDDSKDVKLITTPIDDTIEQNGNDMEESIVLNNILKMIVYHKKMIKINPIFQISIFFLLTIFLSYLIKLSVLNERRYFTFLVIISLVCFLFCYLYCISLFFKDFYIITLDSFFLGILLILLLPNSWVISMYDNFFNK
jgi:hypothetical protein